MTKNLSFKNVWFRLVFGLSLATIALLVVCIPALVKADTLTRQLELGNSGADVSLLQTFLAGDTDIYPQGLITGYFGFLTKAAVSNFQSDNSIQNVGRVGPVTLSIINSQMSAGGISNGESGDASIISNVKINTSNNSANVSISWDTNKLAKGLVYYNSNPLVLSEHKNSVGVSGGYSAMTDNSLRTSQNVSLSGLQSNTVYYYMIYTTDQEGDVSVSWPKSFRTNQ